jgi:Arc/MetJ family transcription regulator
MRTTIDVDRRAAEAAAKVLQTASLKETVNAALFEVLAVARRRRLAGKIRAGTLSAPTPAELARLRSPRVPTGALHSPGRRGGR